MESLGAVSEPLCQTHGLRPMELAHRSQKKILG